MRFRACSSSAAAWFVVAPLLLASGFAGQGPGGESSAAARGPELQQRLAAPLSIAWDNVSLAGALARLGDTQGIAVVRDRRIDPQQPLELTIDAQPLSEVLTKIARELKIGYCQFGPVAYFGPARAARRLRTLAALRDEEARSLPDAASRKFVLMRDWHWDRLSQPRQLALRLADEAEVELVGAERIPHDLWPAADLPPMAWVDRLTLLAAQFDLTFRIDPSGRRVELVEVPGEVVLSRDYLGGGDAERLARRWARALPAASIEVQGRQIRVAARLEDHERLEAGLRGRPLRRTTVTPGKEMYQLAVEQAALEAVVGQLARRIGLKVEWDRAAIDAAGISTAQRISVQVADADLDELLEAVFAGTGLAFERRDRSLVIRPE